MEDGIYSTVLPIFYISKVLGLAPYTYTERSNASGKATFKLITSRINIAYSFFICSLVFITSISSIILEHSTGNFPKSIPEIILFSSPTIFSISSLILAATINRVKLETLLSTFHLVDAILYKNKKNHHRKEKKQFLLRLTLILTVISTVMIFDCIVGTIAVGITNVYYVHLYLEMTIEWVVTLQFMSYIIILKHRFKFLNSQLLHLLRYKNTIHSKLHLKQFPLKNPERIFPLRNERKEIDLTHKDILYYNFAHELLSDAADLIISIYEIQIFISVISSILSLTVWLYFMFSSIYKHKNDHFISNIFFSNMLMTFLDLLKLCFIILPSYSVNVEVGNTVFVLQKLLIRVVDRNKLDELQRFSQLAVFRQFKLAILGVFTLDVSLFFSIIGTVLTYFIVLMQFKISEYSSQYSVPCNNTC